MMEVSNLDSDGEYEFKLKFVYGDGTTWTEAEEADWRTVVSADQKFEVEVLLQSDVFPWADTNPNFSKLIFKKKAITEVQNLPINTKKYDLQYGHEGFNWSEVAASGGSSSDTIESNTIKFGTLSMQEIDINGGFEELSSSVTFSSDGIWLDGLLPIPYVATTLEVHPFESINTGTITGWTLQRDAGIKWWCNAFLFKHGEAAVGEPYAPDSEPVTGSVWILLRGVTLKRTLTVTPAVRHKVIWNQRSFEHSDAAAHTMTVRIMENGSELEVTVEADVGIEWENRFSMSACFHDYRPPLD